MNGTPQKARLFLALPALVLSFVIYLNSLGGAFQFDDYHHIYNNVNLQSLKNVPSFFADPETFSAEKGVAMYRPVLLLTFALNYALGHKDPFGYHLLNVLLHSLCTLSVFLLLRRLFEGRAAPFFGALFFAAAAIHSQPVNYISSRSEILATFFVLAALLMHPGPAHSNRSYFRVAAAGVLFILGLLSKEIAFAFPLLVLVLELGARGFEWKALKKVIAPLVLYFSLALAYLVLRMLMFGSVIDEVQRSILYNLLTLCRSLFWYVHRILLPVNLTIFPNYRISHTLADPAALVAIAALVIISIFVLLNLRKLPWIAAGLAWFVIALLPSSSIMPLNVAASEQRIYLACVGLIIAALSAVRVLGLATRYRGATLTLVSLVIIFQAGMTLDRNRDWRTEISLWNDAVHKQPLASATWAWLGASWTKEQDLDRAEKTLRNSLELNPQHPTGLYYLGMVLREKGKLDDAAKVFGFLAELSTVDFQLSDALGQLGLVFFDMEDFKRAGQSFTKALAIEPGHFYSLYGLGLIAEKSEKYNEAEDFYSRALQTNPEAPEVFSRMGSIYLARGEPEKARTYLESVAAKDLDWPEVHLNLGAVYNALGEKTKSEASFQKCLEIDPDNAKCNMNLGASYANASDWEPAQAYMLKAIKLDPELSQAREYLAVLLLKKLERGQAEGNTRAIVIEQVTWFQKRGLSKQASGLMNWLGRIEQTGPRPRGDNP